MMPIQATELYLSPLRAGVVTRPRLLGLLTAGMQERRKLTLISAPARGGEPLLSNDMVF